MSGTIQEHFVTFYSPGTFVAETSERPIDAWDPEVAKQMAREIKERHGAVPYGFRFSTRSRGPEDLDSKVTATSPMYYLGGKVETLAEVKARATDDDRILVSNMEGNGYERIITNNNSWRWTQPLEATDLVPRGYCVRHQREREARRPTEEPWRALYRTPEWRRLRAQKLATNPFCECEACTGRQVRAEVVDHRIPHRGDRELFLDWNNLQSLSARCHNKKTAYEVNSRR